MAQIEQEFKLRDLTDNPSYYLGDDLKQLPNGRYHISSATYTKEMIRKYQADYISPFSILPGDLPSEPPIRSEAPSELRIELPLVRPQLSSSELPSEVPSEIPSNLPSTTTS
jgi:hypothetical protein